MEKKTKKKLYAHIRHFYKPRTDSLLEQCCILIFQVNISHRF